MRQRIDLNDSWEFTEVWDEDFLRGTEAGPVRKYETVRLPHTCKETPYHYFDESVYQMICGYRRVIRAPESWKDRRVFLTIGAAAHEAEVYLNGESLAVHSCGYTVFTVDMTEYLQTGEDNLLAIRVDSREQLNIPPFGYVIDYMTYGGLYREVWLDVTDQVRIADVFIRPEIPSGERLLQGIPEKMLRAGYTGHVRFEGTVKTELQIDKGETRPEQVKPGSDAERLTIRQTVFCDGQVLVQKTFAPETCSLRERQTVEGSAKALQTELTVPGAQLWDVLSPTLYRMRTELMRDDEMIDCMETAFGFRKAVFGEKGFFLNGRKLKIVGLNRHQSFPYVGYAMPESQQKQDADILRKELGLNAVRTSHYPQSPYFVDRCDEIGLMVFTEIPGWQHIGDDAWKKQALRNTQEMVLQYRNHPSVILWGVRINESADDDEFYKQTNEIAHSLDDTRQTGGVRCHKNSSLLEDVYTYNDFLHDGTNAGCEPKKKVTSDRSKAYMVTEYNGHMFPTKSFDSELHRRDHALRHARVLNDIAQEEDIAGSFGWCFADYNTHRDFGSGDRICYHGVMDMFRNPKQAAAVYASLQEEVPVLEVSSSMDIGEHPTGNQQELYVFTNAEQVRMYKNDRLLKVYEAVNPAFPALKHPPVRIDDFVGDAVAEGENFTKRQAALVKDILNFGAIYGFKHMSPRILAEAGILMQQYRMSFEDAYKLYGKYIGSWGGTATVYRFEAVCGGEAVKSVIKAPAERVCLETEPDHTDLREGHTYDVAAVRIRARDQNGNILPFYQGAVRLETEGPIRIMGPDTAQLRGGMGGTYVKTTGEEGKAVLRLTGEQSEPVEILFRTFRRSVSSDAVLE